MILPQIRPGQIGVAAQSPFMGQATMGQAASRSPYDLQAQALAIGNQQGLQMGASPGSSIVPQMPMTVQHPVAQLPKEAGGGGAAPQANTGLQAGLKGLQQIMGAAQKTFGSPAGPSQAQTASATPAQALPVQAPGLLGAIPTPDATAAVTPPVTPIQPDPNVFGGLGGLLGIFGL